MGKKDTVTKNFMSDNAVFADAFNFYVYGGRQVIDPDSLQELDATELAVIYGEEGQPDTDQRYRDVLKSASFMADGKRTYVILGVENQDRVHYAMPVRNSVYDALQYVKQVRRTAALHRQHRDQCGHTEDEFLSGFYREDRLQPVITLVLYFGKDPWDGPMSLHEMMEEDDPELLRYVHDYRINLLQAAGLEDEDFARFRTSLGAVLKFIGLSSDRDRLQETLETGNFPVVPVEAAMVIRESTGVNFKISKDAEVVDVCEAFDAIVKEREDLAEARGKVEGREEGREEGRLGSLYELAGKGLLALNVAAAEAGQTEAEFRAGMDAYYA